MYARTFLMIPALLCASVAFSARMRAEVSARRHYGRRKAVRLALSELTTTLLMELAFW